MFSRPFFLGFRDQYVFEISMKKLGPFFKKNAKNMAFPLALQP